MDISKAAFWRAFRVIVVTALVQTFAMSVDWSNPQQAFKALATSFISGVIIGTGKIVRDNFGDNKTTTGNLINKMPI